MTNYWAMYKGDDIITHGTLQEIADKLDYDYEYVRWMSAPSIRKRMSKGKNRMIMVEVPDIEEEN